MELQGAKTRLLWASPLTTCEKNLYGVHMKKVYDYDDNEWVVDRILDVRRREVRMSRHIYKKEIEYLVLWKGYPREYASWEPQEHTTNCQEKIDKFWKYRKHNRS